MATPCQSKPVTLVLDDDPRTDGDRPRTITYDNRADFRMGSLERPFSVHDLNHKRRGWAALVAWVWACLSERDTVDFPSPESLAPHLKDPDIVAKAIDAFLETYLAAQPDPAKNAGG